MNRSATGAILIVVHARRYLLVMVAALYFGALISLAFLPLPAIARIPWFVLFAAFVPVGVLLLALLGPRRWWAAIGFAVLGCAWIEAAQSIWMPDGFTDLSDVAWTSAGAIVGVVASVVVASSRGRAQRTPSLVSQAAGREIPQD